MSKSNLDRAKTAKNDEFYTRLYDIENEMRHYKPHFKDKVIYMNTDHPDKSNFWLFFKLQFNHLKPKKIISTFYNEEGPSFKTEYDGAEEVRTPLRGDGDFRSDECVNILKESDIVVTNPPFSLFREFVNLIMEHKKRFLVIGNSNAITYKETFPLIKENKMWLGSTEGKMEFLVPDYAEWNAKQREDSKGRRFQAFGNITWFTNLDYPKRHEDILLWASYKGSEDEYPRYDNYDAINIDRVANIPYDYEGVMGVPISFIGKWNPDQFEILGSAKTPICYDNDTGAERIKKYENVVQFTQDGRKLPGNKVNDGPTIVVDTKPSTGTYYINEDTGEIVIAKYARILIRNKKPREELI